MKAQSLSVVYSVSALLLFGSLLQAQKKANPAAAERETVAKPLTEKERRKQEEKLRKELMGPY
ncbi:MAG TPA: GWxTD domain-containing protein, partial [Bryobacteraceae bacterium]|nr:GWxTD domain-containing protein [Bryobacteraceae bacterium]